MPVKIIAIGKKHEKWLTEGISRYENRLQSPFKLSWVLLPNSPKKGVVATEEESETILKQLNASNYVILLDERGKMIDSPALSRLLAEKLDHSKEVVFIIGGAYGASSKLQQRAQYIWSLSSLVFPHQLVRLMLVEQLYRAQAIYKGTPYHNE